MDLDVRTLILILGITHVIQVGVFLHQYRMARAYPGVGWWLLGSTMATAGFAAIFLRQAPAFRSLAIVFQNGLVLLAVVFIYVGVQRFFGRRVRLAAIGGFAAAAVAALAFFVYVHDDIAARVVIISVALAATAAMIARALFTGDIPAIATTARATAVVFLLHGAVFGYRAAMVLLGEPAGDVFESTLFNALPYLDGVVTGLLWMVGLVLMINQRLHGETAEARRQLELVFNTGPDAAIITRLEDGLVVSVNDAFSELSGHRREEAVGRTTADLNLWPDPADRDRFVQDLIADGLCRNREIVLLRKDGTPVTSILSARRFVMDGEAYAVSMARDITAYKSALAEVRTLSALLPICMHCKQVRNDSGYWEQIETYITSRSATQLSHGICPACLAKHYPEEADDGAGT